MFNLLRNGILTFRLTLTPAKINKWDFVFQPGHWNIAQNKLQLCVFIC